MNDKLRIYLSHPIRGKKGEKATKQDIDENIAIVRKQADELRSYFLDWYRMDGWPDIYLYVPGEHDEFVQLAYDKGYLNIDQILEIDCDIVDTCDLVIGLGKYVSSGMQVEYTHAIKECIPLFACKTLQKCVIDDLKNIIKLIQEGKHV